MSLADLGATGCFELEDSYALIRNRKLDIPFGMRLSHLEFTGADFNPQEYLQGSWAKTFPKWQFKATDLKVYSSKPIEVVITREKGTYFAENESLEIYASGDSEHEVIEDFCQHVIYFYKHYKQLGWDKVIGHARRLKETYESLFQEAG